MVWLQEKTLKSNDQFNRKIIIQLPVCRIGKIGIYGEKYEYNIWHSRRIGC